MRLLDIDPLTPALGAEIRLGADARVDGMLIDELVSALQDHHVVAIRDAHLSPASMVRIAEGFGDLGVRHHSYVSHPEHRDVVVLEWGPGSKPDAVEWHADMTYREEPPVFTLLQAVEVPPCGGDTLFASMFSVHDALPAGLRSDLEQLEAVHDLGAFRSSAYLEGGQAGLEKAVHESGTAVHPVIAQHPVTGRPYLNVSESFTRFVIGMSAPESARLLTHLFDLINRPEHQVRIRWKPGTMAIWDNRGTQHYAVADYLPNRRVMHRVVVAADRRVGG